MRRYLQPASVWAFSALFGCISLFGPGWHCFVGHAYHAHFHGSTALHDCCGGQHTGELEAGTPCAAAHEALDHAHGDHEHAEGLADGGARLNAVAVHDGDCPLCRFFAQAAWTGEASADELDLPGCEEAAPTDHSARRVHRATYRSRAPPESTLLG